MAWPKRSRAASTLLLLACCALGASGVAAAPPTARGARGMVVSPDVESARVGVEVLRAGGNAVNAAVATALALAVTYPAAGNLGGGGFLLHRTADGRHHALDFRETAPRRLLRASFLDEDGRAVPQRSRLGGLAVAVPGSVAGLAEAHRRWGRLSWSHLCRPAIRLAEQGFEVSPWLASAFVRSGEVLLADAEARAIFANQGRLPRAGEVLVQRDLAATLRRVAERGARGFHRGPVAEALENAVARRGGLLDRRDLADYRPVLREPLTGSYHGYRVVTFPPPSSGGILLLQILGMLEDGDLAASGWGSRETAQRMTEAFRRAFADRSRWIDDPAFFEVPVGPLLDRAYLAGRMADFDPERATPSARIAAGQPAPAGSGETLHLSVADADGAAVALTTTLNGWFGCGIVADGTGVLLNNEIDDFALAPGQPDQWGLVGGEVNAIEPGKRPLSSMTPTIVEFPEPGRRPALVLGSPGGGTIITSVAHVLINHLDHRMPLDAAVSAARFHHQWLPDRIEHEARALAEGVRDELAARGYELQEIDRPLGTVNAIGLAPDGAWLGAADARRDGAALGY